MFVFCACLCRLWKSKLGRTRQYIVRRSWATYLKPRILQGTHVEVVYSGTDYILAVLFR